MSSQKTDSQARTDTATEPTIVALPDDAKTVLENVFGADTRLTDLGVYENADGHQFLTDSSDSHWVRIRSTLDGLLAEEVDADTVDEDDLDTVTRTDPAQQDLDLGDISTERRRRGD